ncbi:hypothetical protein OHC33_007926 [Knufia fluminis]|uniref:Uncharacterized protein n=1 Tax=Knufia fluminis TaxID=191047 RepID=A0AAN8EGT6_9EURO|nr:hypothetical protein OHC33_007926 [Knufia fluminis]
MYRGGEANIIEGCKEILRQAFADGSWRVPRKIRNRKRKLKKQALVPESDDDQDAMNDDDEDASVATSVPGGSSEGPSSSRSIPPSDDWEDVDVDDQDYADTTPCPAPNRRHRMSEIENDTTESTQADPAQAARGRVSGLRGSNPSAQCKRGGFTSHTHHARGVTISALHGGSAKTARHLQHPRRLPKPGKSGLRQVMTADENDDTAYEEHHTGQSRTVREDSEIYRIRATDSVETTNDRFRANAIRAQYQSSNMPEYFVSRSELSTPSSGLSYDPARTSEFTDSSEDYDEPNSQNSAASLDRSRQMSKTKHKENRQRVAERGTQSRESEQFVPARVEVRVPDRTTIIERNKHQQRPEGICEDDGSDDAMVDADEDSHLTGLRQTTANDFPTDEHMPESNEAHQGQVASFSKKSKKKADRKSYASRSRNEKGKATKTRKQANKSSLSSSQACAQTGSTQQLLDGEDRTVSTEAEHHDAGVPVSYAPHGAMNSSPAAFAAEVESDDVIPSIEFGRAKRSLQQRTAQFFGSYDTEFTSYAQSGLLSRVTEMDAPTLTLGAPKHDHKNSRTSQAHVAAETLTSVTSVVSKKRRRADEEEVAKAEDNATQAARANTPSSTPDNVNDRKKRKSKDKERASSWQPVDEKDQPEIACTSQTSHDQVNHPASPSLTRPGPSRIERAASHVGTPPDLTLATNSSSDAKKRQKKQKRAKQPQPQLTNQTAPVTDMPPPQRITDIRGGAGTDVNPYLLYTPQKPKDSIKKASNAEAFFGK